MTTAGGRRTGQGRTSEFKQEQAKESTQLAMQRLMAEISAEDQHEIIAALVAKAKGIKVLAVVEWKGAKRVLIEGEEEFRTSRGEPCWIYTTAPDTQAAKLLVDHLKGKAATQPQVNTDTVINLVHAVQRPRRGKG